MSTTTTSKLAIVFAGEEFDGHDASHPKIQIRTADGIAEVCVRVRAMPARHLGRVSQLASKEAELLEFVCMVATEKSEGEEIAGWRRLPEGWADNLVDESHALLYQAADRLNFTRAVIFVKRQIAAKKLAGGLMLECVEELTPMLMAMMEPMLKEIRASLDSSPRRPIAPAAPSTPS